MTNLYMWSCCYLIWFACEYGPRLLPMRLKRIGMCTLLIFAGTAMPSCRRQVRPVDMTIIEMMPAPRVSGHYIDCGEGWEQAAPTSSGQVWCYRIRPDDIRASAQPSLSPK